MGVAALALMVTMGLVAWQQGWLTRPGVDGPGSAPVVPVDEMASVLEQAESLYQPPSVDAEATYDAAEAYAAIIEAKPYEDRALNRQERILDEIVLWAEAAELSDDERRGWFERALALDATHERSSEALAALDASVASAAARKEQAAASARNAKERRAKAERACAIPDSPSAAAVTACADALRAAAKYPANSSFVASTRSAVGPKARRRADVALAAARTRGSYEAVEPWVSALDRLGVESAWVASTRRVIDAASVAAAQASAPGAQEEKIRLLLQVAENPGSPVLLPWDRSQLKAYKEILDIDPSHSTARSRANAIRKAQSSKAQTTLAKGDPRSVEEAMAILLPLSQAFPTDREVGSLLDSAQKKKDAFARVARLTLLIKRPGGGRGYGTVFIDGVNRGSETTFDLSPGTHEIRVEAPLVRTWSGEVVLEGGGQKKLEIQLERP